jgi:hypothetical protein
MPTSDTVRWRRVPAWLLKRRPGLTYSTLKFNYHWSPED